MIKDVLNIRQRRCSLYTTVCKRVIRTKMQIAFNKCEMLILVE